MDAVRDGVADVCFLAIDPGRADTIAFTRPYVVIEGAYAVPSDSAITTLAHVDRPGIRIGVKLGSAYDLHLARTIAHATLVRGADGVVAYADEGLEVAAGIRQPTEAYAAVHPGMRVLPESFMQIHQAAGTAVDRDAAVREWLDAVLGDLIAAGWVADALARHGHDQALAVAAG